MAGMIDFAHNGTTYTGYLAESVSGRGPGIVVIQEWWGLNNHIKSIADRFAEAGFTALAPDFYVGQVTEEPDEAGKLMMALNIGETERILAKACEYLESHVSTEAKGIGAVGFCMGGQLALLAATTCPSIKAAVDFYGIHPNVQPDYSKASGAIQGHFAEHDSSTSPEIVAALADKLAATGVIHEFYSYPGTHHAFFNDTRPSVYSPADAALAWDRTVDFFRSRLSS